MLLNTPQKRLHDKMNLSHHSCTGCALLSILTDCTSADFLLEIGRRAKITTKQKKLDIKGDLLP
ncbi:MAG: hypothetical protein PWK00_06680, partial [Coxiella burnetii]|nr:hypothetical protein [Coxiella burnetii]